MKSTTEVLNHHLQAFGEGMDAILSDYSEESTILTPAGTFKGLSAIREFFSGMIGSLPEGFMEAMKITYNFVDGEVAFITWESLPWMLMATDTFVIREGKIHYQTFAAHQAE
jgi:hypothetical protein